MRRPENVVFVDNDTRELRQIEDYVDSKLSTAESLGLWPVEIGLSTSRWRSNNILAVLDKYRKAGWIIDNCSHQMHDYTCTIDHPARQL